MEWNRRWAVAAVAVMMVLVLALAGCAKSEPEEEEEEEMEGVANPWSDVATAQEAADGAGVETFECAGIELSLGTTEPKGYRCMKGIAEAQFPIAAVDMTIRKGTDEFEDVDEGDISGDYTDYTYNWTKDVDGVEVTCFGTREGDSTKTIWTKDGYNYSVLAFGAGGDEDFGLNEADVETLVKNIK